MPLDLVSDDIGDHASPDATVYRLFNSNSNQEPPATPALLMAVVATSRDKMDKKLANAKYFLQILEQYSLDPGADENSNLKKLLRSCWQRGSFKEIRCLSEHSSTT